MNHFVVTVARGFGSGGKVIAAKVAEQINANCYENRILTLASLLSGMDEHYFEQANEKLSGIKIAQQLSVIPKTVTPKPNAEKFAADDMLFDYQAQIIRRLANTETCVIVGKCADHVLRSYDNVVSVYIEAPRAFCVNRITNRMGISEEEAHKLIEQTDKYRADYYKYYTGGNYWTNPVNYDLTLNSERVGVDNCVKVILDYINLKFGTHYEMKEQI